MSADTNPLSEAVKSYLEEIQPENEAHPSREDWAAYRSKDLPESERERLQDHLIQCDSCLESLQGLCFELPEPATVTVGEFEGKSFQRLIQAKLEAETRPTKHPSSILPLALAASLLLAISSLVAWATRGGQIQRLTQPHLQAQTALLDTAVYRGGPEVVVMKAGTESLTLDLEWPRGQSFSHYQVTLVGANGKRLWSSGLLAEPPANLVLNRHWIKENKLAIILSGGGRGSTKELGNYPLHIS